MRVQRVLMPGSEAESWTVLGDDQVPVEPVERFLGYLTSGSGTAAPTPPASSPIASSSGLPASICGISARS